MPRKRKRSTSLPKGIAGPSAGLGASDREGPSSIQQGLDSTSQSVRSNIRHHTNEPEAMASPRHRHPPPHSPSSHFQPLYEPQHPSQSYSPPNSNTHHSHPHPLYHHNNSSHPYHNSPDHDVQPSHASSYSMHDQSPPNTNPPPNPHAPSHYNFANRAYAQQRDSGFNTFRVNPGPVPTPIAVNASPVPPPINAAAPLHSPPMPVPPPVYQHHQYPDEDAHHFRHRSYSHSQPAASTSSSVPASHARLSPPLAVSREPATRDEFESVSRNGTRRSRRDRIRNGNESPLTSSDDDLPYNPATAGGRSRAMVKYLIMKAKYRYVLKESELLRDDLNSLKREEHRQWRLKEAGVDDVIKSFGSDSDRLIHDGDRQAQQYLLDHDNDSTDWDMDMLRELDRERRAFRERERERDGQWVRDHDRGGYATGIGHDDRGRVQPVDINRDRDGVVDQTPMSMPSSLPESRREGRDARQGEQQRARSSPRSCYESRLDSQSFHYSPHPYRRTPPPSLPLDRDVQFDPLTHPTTSPAQSSSRLDKGDNQYATQRRAREQDDVGPDYKRYPHQRRHSSGNVHGEGHHSPAPPPGHYQSPPPQSHSHQQYPARSPAPPSHSYIESTERPGGSRVQSREHAEQRSRSYEYKYGPGSSRSPRCPPLESDSAKTSASPPVPHSSSKVTTVTHLPTQEELKREQEPDAPPRSSLLEEYEKAINTTSKAGQNPIGGAPYDCNQQQHPSSSSSRPQVQSVVHSYLHPPAQHTSSSSPTPPAHRSHAQMQIDETVKHSRTREEQSQDHPSTSSAVLTVPSLSSSNSPRQNSTPNPGFTKSPTISQPPQPLSSPRKSLSLDSTSSTLGPPTSSNVPLSSQPSPPRPQGNSTPAVPVSPPHNSRSNSDTPSADPVSHLPDLRPKTHRYPSIPKGHNPRYAYAYYPDSVSEDEADDDVGTVRNPGGTTKDSAVSGNVGSNGNVESERNNGSRNGQTHTEASTSSAIKDAMDID